MTTFLLLMVSLFITACTLTGEQVRGDGDIVTREVDLESFDAIEASGAFKITLTEGSKPHITIATDQNLQEYIVAEVKNQTLTLEMRGKKTYSPTQLEVQITTPSLKKLKLSGATSLSADYTIQTPSLEIQISGAAQLSLGLETHELNTRISGAGKIDLSGLADHHQLHISGAAAVNSVSLKTLKTKVRLSGAGSAHVYASQHLDATVSGIGTIQYKGNPIHIQTNTSGIGSIKPI